jgi:hypothetical protein
MAFLSMPWTLWRGAHALATLRKSIGLQIGNLATAYDIGLGSDLKRITPTQRWGDCSLALFLLFSLQQFLPFIDGAHHAVTGLNIKHQHQIG